MASKRPRAVAWLLALVAIGATDLLAQGKFPPDSLVNLEVLPKGTPVREVIGMMRGFTGALGVRCTHCHVGQEGQPLSSYDFASDEKPAKEAARTMLRMVAAINTEHLAKLAPHPGPKPAVTCETCHRGVSRPVPIERIVEEGLAVSADSAGQAYRSLSRRYRDRGSYDFSEGPLGAVAQRLAAGGRFDDALAITALNDEAHPSSAVVPLLRGEVLLVKKDTAGAVAAFRLAIERDPSSPARQRLAQLGVRP